MESLSNINRERDIYIYIIKSTSEQIIPSSTRNGAVKSISASTSSTKSVEEVVLAGADNVLLRCRLFGSVLAADASKERRLTREYNFESSERTKTYSAFVSVPERT